MESRFAPRRFVSSAVLALALGAASAPPAFAAFLNWNNPAGGQASVASNWSPAQVPVAGDVLQFNLNNLYTVSFNASTPASSQMLFRDGNVSMSFLSPHTVSQVIRLGDTPDDTVITRLNNGTLTANSFVVVGDQGDSDATLMVRTANMILSIQGATSDLAVGNFGKGTLIVESGGSVEVSDDVLIGANTNSEGYVLVEGRSVVPLVPSNLVTTTSTSDILVGATGYGELAVEAHGMVFSSGDLKIAPNDLPFFDGNAIVTIGGGTGGLATLTVDQDLDLATGGTGGGGIGTLNVLSNGVLEVHGMSRIGGFGNSDAIFNIAGSTTGGNFTSTNLAIDENAVFNFPSGRVTVDGGTLTTDGEPLTVNSPTGSALIGPIFKLTNGGTASPPDTGSSPYSIRAGTTGFGIVAADNGGVWTPTDDVILGESTGGVGILQLSNGGKVAGNFTTIQVGLDGTGTANVVSGGLIDVALLQVGTDFNGVGTVNVDGSGSDITLANSFTLGAGVAAPEPVSVLSLTNTGTVNVESPSSVSIIQGSGGLSVASGAQVTTAGDIWVLSGEINLNQGFVVADSILIGQFGSELNGVGFIAADVTNAGITAPGFSAGELEIISGSFVQPSTGKLRIELGKHSAGEWDVLSVSGPATLGGTLELTQLPTYSGAVGDVFTIMTFTSRTGTFASVTLNGGPLSGFNLDYTSTNVTLKVTGATDAPDLAALPSEIGLVGWRTPAGGTLELSLPSESDVRLSFFDVTGREIGVLREGRTAAGRHRFDLGSSRSLASGIYFGRAVVQTNGGGEVRTARIPIIR